MPELSGKFRANILIKNVHQNFYFLHTNWSIVFCFSHPILIFSYLWINSDCGHNFHSKTLFCDRLLVLYTEIIQIQWTLLLREADILRFWPLESKREPRSSNWSSVSGPSRLWESPRVHNNFKFVDYYYFYLLRRLFRQSRGE